MPLDDLIAQAYSPENIGLLGSRLFSLLEDHFRQVECRQTPVLPWVDPEQNVADAGASLDATTADSLAERFETLVRTTLDHG